MPEPDSSDEDSFEDLMHDLEDNIFGIEQGEGEGEEKKVEDKKEEGARKPRRKSLPALIDEATAHDILRDFMKEKNQRKYDIMGLEIFFKPYWFFSYTCELILKDEGGNIVDSQEIGGRTAIDAITGELVDYLEDLMENEPIEVVDLADELSQMGGDVRVLEPKISKTELEKFVQQKISGALRADKENVSVAGFELLWSPVYKFWLTIGKRTHNVQIDGCGGYPINYDNVPLKPKSWIDILRDDISLLKEPRKWGQFLKRTKTPTISSRIKSKTNTMEIILSLMVMALFFYGLSERSVLWIIGATIMAIALFWYMNRKRERPPLPPIQQPPPSQPQQ